MVNNFVDGRGIRPFSRFKSPTRLHFQAVDPGRAARRKIDQFCHAGLR
jgi:hypothetical protein